MRPIIIFGASVLGEKALKSFKPICFVDNDPRKQAQGFHGYKVLSFEDLRLHYPNAIIVIAADRYYDEIYEQVHPYYSEIYHVLNHISNKGLYLDQLNVVVTERCTLKCEQCSSLMPLYRNPKDCDTNVLLTALGDILECISYIGRVEVLGGEPFLNKDLPKIIDRLKFTSKISQIDVITNGTLIPRSVDYLIHPKICVVINQYEVSKKIEKLVNKLSKTGVIYRINMHWAWANLGDFKNRGRNKEELKSLFKKCNFNTCTELLNGKLYRCPRSSHGTNLGVIPDISQDYITVINSKNLKDLFNKEYITACNYCNGNTRQTLNLEPGIQL